MQKIRASKALNYFQNIYIYKAVDLFHWNCRYSIVLKFEFQNFWIFGNCVVLQEIWAITTEMDQVTMLGGFYVEFGQYM